MAESEVNLLLERGATTKKITQQVTDLFGFRKQQLESFQNDPRAIRLLEDKWEDELQGVVQLLAEKCSISNKPETKVKSCQVPDKPANFSHQNDNSEIPQRKPQQHQQDNLPVVAKGESDEDDEVGFPPRNYTDQKQVAVPPDEAYGRPNGSITGAINKDPQRRLNHRKKKVADRPKSPSGSESSLQKTPFFRTSTPVKPRRKSMPKFRINPISPCSDEAPPEFHPARTSTPKDLHKTPQPSIRLSPLSADCSEEAPLWAVAKITKRNTPEGDKVTSMEIVRVDKTKPPCEVSAYAVGGVLTINSSR